MKRNKTQKRKNYMQVKSRDLLSTQIVPSNYFRYTLESDNFLDHNTNSIFSILVKSIRKNILISHEEHIKNLVLNMKNSPFEAEYLYIYPLIDDKRKRELEIIENQNQSMGIPLLLAPNEKEESYNPKEVFIPADENPIVVTYVDPGWRKIKLICEISDLYIDENKMVNWFNANIINDSFSFFGPIYL